MLRLRPHRLLEAARAEAVTDLARTQHKLTDGYMRGAVAAFDWLLGLVPAAPITGATEITHASVVEVERLAEDAVYRRRGAPDVSPGWANGVNHAVLWARGRTADPPAGYTDELAAAIGLEL